MGGRKSCVKRPDAFKSPKHGKGHTFSEETDDKRGEHREWEGWRAPSPWLPEFHQYKEIARYAIRGIELLLVQVLSLQRPHAIEYFTNV